MLAGKSWLDGEIRNLAEKLIIKRVSRIIGILRNRTEGDDDDWIGIDSKRGFN